jgi:F0F1-type ATP synthase assembly protein I
MNQRLKQHSHAQLGTLFGAIYGLVGQKIAGTNPYGLVAVMTFQAFFTNYLIIFKPRYQGVGIVG